MKTKIAQLTQEYFKDIQLIRRHIHQNPELSFQEEKTAAYIMQELDKLAIPYRHHIGGNGIVATLESGKSKKIIAIRADFDALPIEEKTNLPYASINKGVMHACGHDMHTASLLGVARLLKTIAKDWEGIVHFVFQPAEELLPGGAQQMIQENLFEDKQPQLIIAQHVDPDILQGEIGVKSGVYMASGDEIYLKIKGQGGHAALPHKINDTVLAAAQVLINLQQISARLAPATIPTVLSFGKISAEGATNLIPNQVKIAGTFRTFDEKWRKKAHQHIKRIAKSTAEAMSCTCDVEVRSGYPVLKNDIYWTNKFKEQAQKILTKESVLDLDYRMTTEDFAYFSHQYPVVYYRLGVANKEDKNNFPLHSSRFSPSEAAIQTAVNTISNFVYNFFTN